MAIFMGRKGVGIPKIEDINTLVVQKIFYENLTFTPPLATLFLLASHAL
jgi:hypothetical protein